MTGRLSRNDSKTYMTYVDICCAGHKDKRIHAESSMPMVGVKKYQQYFAVLTPKLPTHALAPRYATDNSWDTHDFVSNKATYALQVCEPRFYII